MTRFSKNKFTFAILMATTLGSAVPLHASETGSRSFRDLIGQTAEGVANGQAVAGTALATAGAASILNAQRLSRRSRALDPHGTASPRAVLELIPESLADQPRPHVLPETAREMGTLMKMADVDSAYIDAQGEIRSVSRSFLTENMADEIVKSVNNYAEEFYRGQQISTHQLAESPKIVFKLAYSDGMAMQYRGSLAGVSAFDDYNRNEVIINDTVEGFRNRLAHFQKNYRVTEIRDFQIIFPKTTIYRRAVSIDFIRAYNKGIMSARTAISMASKARFFNRLGIFAIPSGIVIAASAQGAAENPLAACLQTQENQVCSEINALIAAQSTLAEADASTQRPHP